MPLFYKGVRYGTYWYHHYTSGFFAPKFDLDYGNDYIEIINHIIKPKGSAESPFLSITSSYGVALSYAKRLDVPNLKGLIYVIESDQGAGLRLVDPVKRIAEGLKAPHDYQHSGSPDCFIELLKKGATGRIENDLFPNPPGSERVKNWFSDELTAIAFALRDSESLVLTEIPSDCVVEVYEV